MAEGSRHLTAFVTHRGLFEWVRVPFGLSNVSTAFEQSIEDLDDVLCFAKSFKEHEEKM